MNIATPEAQHLGDHASTSMLGLISSDAVLDGAGLMLLANPPQSCPQALKIRLG